MIKAINRRHLYTTKIRRKKMQFPTFAMKYKGETLHLNWHGLALVASLTLVILILALTSISVMTRHQATINDYQMLLTAKESQIVALQTLLEDQEKKLNAYNDEVHRLQAEVNATMDALAKQIESTMSTLTNEPQESVTPQ